MLIWLPAAPAGSGCVNLCSAFVSVPAGGYAFTFQSSTRDFVVQSPLPPPGGVVEIPIHR